jgi:hypothetical protein
MLRSSSSSSYLDLKSPGASATVSSLFLFSPVASFSSTLAAAAAGARATDGGGRTQTAASLNSCLMVGCCLLCHRRPSPTED